MLTSSLLSLYVKTFCLSCRDIQTNSSRAQKLELKVGRTYCRTENCPCCISEYILIFDYGGNSQEWLNFGFVRLLGRNCHHLQRQQKVL